MSTEAPIIIIKKKGGHGGHHGGAWKVAFADFVTAMMALFIVLWLMNSTPKETQEAISGYFKDPSGTSTKHGSTMTGSAEKLAPKSEDLSKLKADLQSAIQHVAELNKLSKQIEMTITDEGLRIELLEDTKGTFFEIGSPQPTKALGDLLKVLAKQLKDVPNTISIEGHTDATAYTNGTVYGNWELSADRANVARRIMQASGIGVNQVSQVRGFADQRLRKPKLPYDASNRRVSLIVQKLPKGDGQTVVAGPNGLSQSDMTASAKEARPAESSKNVAKPAEIPGSDAKAAEAPKSGSPATALAVVQGKPSAGILERAHHLFGK